MKDLLPESRSEAFALLRTLLAGLWLAGVPKLREQRELVEQIKLERLADAPTPRRRRGRSSRRRVYGLREPFAPAYRTDTPALTAPVAPTLPANEQQALERGLTGPHWLEDKPRPFDAGRYVWS